MQLIGLISVLLLRYRVLRRLKPCVSLSNSKETNLQSKVRTFLINFPNSFRPHEPFGVIVLVLIIMNEAISACRFLKVEGSCMRISTVLKAQMFLIGFDYNEWSNFSLSVLVSGRFLYADFYVLGATFLVSIITHYFFWEFTVLLIVLIMSVKVTKWKSGYYAVNLMI